MTTEGKLRDQTHESIGTAVVLTAEYAATPNPIFSL